MCVFTSDKDTAYLYGQFFRPQYMRGHRGFTGNTIPSRDVFFAGSLSDLIFRAPRKCENFLALYYISVRWGDLPV